MMLFILLALSALLFIWLESHSTDWQDIVYDGGKRNLGHRLVVLYALPGSLVWFFIAAGAIWYQAEGWRSQRENLEGFGRFLLAAREAVFGVNPRED